MRKAVKNVVLTLLLLTLSISTAFLVYLHFFASEDRALSGEWTTELDMTKQAVVAAFCWLEEIEAVSPSQEELEACMQGLTVEVNLTFEQTSRSGGTFHSNVSPESYAVCRQKAYEAFAAAFRELLAKRLSMAGYTGSTDAKALEALVEETFGMSTVSYLMSCGPVLLPSLEELQNGYDGNGTYEAAEGILTRRFENGRAVAARSEYYIRQDAALILSEEIDAVSNAPYPAQYPVMYTLQQPQNEAEKEQP